MSIQPYYTDPDGRITIYHGDCRDILPQLEPVDLLITDPPHGVQKAEWDTKFPVEWLPQAANITTQAMVVMPGVHNVLLCPRIVGAFHYRWMLSMHLSNGMTRGRMGFGNWIPALVYAREGQSLYRPQQDATTIVITGSKPDHPSPKPIRAMSWLVSRFADGIILDPFMGSGTTLRAAKDLGRRAIGIEIEERYCEIAARRLDQQVLPIGDIA